MLKYLKIRYLEEACEKKNQMQLKKTAILYKHPN